MSGIVLKIGGSSLSSHEGFEQAKLLVSQQPDRRYLVVSAPGKRTPSDTKVTDLLISLQTTDHFDQIIEEIRQRYVEIITGLGLDDTVKAAVEKELSGLTRGIARKSVTIDMIASRGEYLSACILAAYLGWPFVDAKDIIRLDADGRYDKRRTEAAFRRYALPERAVIPGFYGTDTEGAIRTFSRGGSDITGAIVAAVTGARLYENATDVPGVSVTNPRVYSGGANGGIPVMTYSQIEEMAYRGAGVLHHEAVYPVRDAGIPVRIFSFMTPRGSDTLIVPDEDKRAPKGARLIGITEKTPFTIFSVRKPGMNADDGFTHRVLAVFAEEGVGHDHLTTGLDSLDIIVPDEKLLDKRERIREELEERLGAAVTTTTDVAVVCVISPDHTEHLLGLAMLLQFLQDGNIRPLFLELGVNRTTLVIGVAAARLPETVKQLYRGMRAWHEKMRL